MEKYEDFLLDDNLKILEQVVKRRKRKKVSETINLDYLTRCIHIGIWDECPSPKLIIEKIIPLLHKAKDYISRKNKYSNHVKESIRLRINNLERYCQGLSSQMFSPEEEKRLLKT